MSMDISRMGQGILAARAYHPARASSISGDEASRASSDMVSLSPSWLDATADRGVVGPGVVSALLSANPTLGKVQLKEILLSSTTSDSSNGSAIIDIHSAFSKALVSAEQTAPENGGGAYVGMSPNGDKLYTRNGNQRHNPTTLTAG